MPDQAIVDNARVITAELAWLDAVMTARFAEISSEEEADPLPTAPSLAGKPGAYAAMVSGLALDDKARLVLILALAPHVAPAALDPFLIKNNATDRPFAEFGGVEGHSHKGFLPTVETALFLVTGTDDLAARIELLDLFADHPLTRGGLLLADPRHPEEPHSAAPLRIPPAGLRELLIGPGAD
jgi:hypothetical protein